MEKLAKGSGDMGRMEERRAQRDINTLASLLMLVALICIAIMIEHL